MPDAAASAGAAAGAPPAALERATALLRALVETESPTGSPGVRLVAERLASELAALGAATTLLPGNHLRADLPGRGRPLVLLAHGDTVWPEGSLAQLPFRVEDSERGPVARGPGSYDMKAGLVQLVEAVRLADPAERRALRILVTADEEVGSVSARPHIATAADGAAAGLVLEPCLSGGGVKLWRKGIGRFRLTVHGRAAHAGSHPTRGVDAIRELAHQILRVHDIADHPAGVTVNVGVVRGGTAENVVAEKAEAFIDVRVARREQMARVDEGLAALAPAHAEARLEVAGEWTRPPLEASAGSELLYAAAARHAAALGIPLAKGGSGGGSDGNLIAAHGVPVLDGLGPDGDGAHAVTEHVQLHSILVRAELLARLICDPGID